MIKTTLILRFLTAAILLWLFEPQAYAQCAVSYVDDASDGVTIAAWNAIYDNYNTGYGECGTGGIYFTHYYATAVSISTGSRSSYASGTSGSSYTELEILEEEIPEGEDGLVYYISTAEQIDCSIAGSGYYVGGSSAQYRSVLHRFTYELDPGQTSNTARWYTRCNVTEPWYCPNIWVGKGPYTYWNQFIHTTVLRTSRWIGFWEVGICYGRNPTAEPSCVPD